MRKLTGIVTVAVCLAANPVRAEVQLTIHNGLVSLTARDATVRQILAEWARVGHTTVVNGEKVSGAPVTLQITEMPEAKALEIVLRSLSGYLAAPRATVVENASRFDRIIVMPTTASVRPATSAPPMPLVRSSYSQPPAAEEPQNEVPEPNVAVPNTPPGAPRPPVFTTFPAPEVAQPPQSSGAPAAPTAAPQTPTAATMPTAPPGVSVPGVIVPAAAPPGSPSGQPGQVPPRQP